LNKLTFIFIYYYFFDFSKKKKKKKTCKPFNEILQHDYFWIPLFQYYKFTKYEINIIENTTEKGEYKKRFLNEFLSFRISGGYHHSIIFSKYSSSMLVCGRNNYGQLGLGDENNRFSFTKLDFPSKLISVSSRFCHSLALCEDNRVLTWGNNSFLQLGIESDEEQQSTPQVISSLNQISICMISCGMFHSVILDSQGRAWMFGDNAWNQLGFKTETDTQKIPKMLEFHERFCLISAGSLHTMSLSIDRKRVFGWGNNSFGELAIGNFDEFKTEPILSLFSSLTDSNDVNIASISSGSHFTIIITSKGEIWSSGYNVNGEVGNNSEEEKFNTPQHVQFPPNTFITQISSGSRHSLALSKNGECFSFGCNRNDDEEEILGQLGVIDDFGEPPREKITPVKVKTSNNLSFIRIHAGSEFSMAVSEDNDVFGWGSNEYGQLGFDPEEHNRSLIPKKLEFENFSTLRKIKIENDENNNNNNSNESKEEEPDNDSDSDSNDKEEKKRKEQQREGKLIKIKTKTKISF